MMRLSLFALMLVALLAGAARAADARPNVVVFLADDQGWGDLSVHGNTNLQTPNIDGLARGGALFERFFVCTVCAPTRAEFLTGRYHPRGGVRGVSTGEERLNPDVQTIADVFRAAGYATGAFGKWHNGSQFPYHPNARGFDEFYGFTSGHWGHYFDADLEHNNRPVKGQGYLTDDLTNHALAFIEQHRAGPFFCYLPYNTPHSPMQVPDEYWNRHAEQQLDLLARPADKEDVPKTRAALAMCENIDWNVGRVLKRLDELKLADNTIVIYFSDNGPNGARWNGDMKGQKGSLDEGGVRAPFFVRWPGHIKPGTKVTPLAGAIDILPTLADLAGIELQSPAPLDGVSLKPLLLGNAKAWPARTYFNFYRGRVSVRTDRYRLDPQGHLFDMQQDPGQRTDVSKARPEAHQQLTAAAAKMQREVSAEQTPDRRPFTVGYAEETPLPARDGVPHGNVKRSAGAPNCSFFTNWSSLEDSITWDVEVGAAGEYEVIVYYTCAAADVGATIELTLGERRVRGNVADAYDPPLRGAESDRVPRRGESYVKDFRPLKLGTLTLDRGRGQLTLRAVEIPGKQVMDVRLLRLRKLDGEKGNK
jgi:arylsulfatase A-like enzyme